jgi:hypothetical protein
MIQVQCWCLERSAVEHDFAGQKHRMKLFMCTVGVARAG